MMFVCMYYVRSEEHTSELQSHLNLVCRLLLEKKNKRFSGGAQHRGFHHTLQSSAPYRHILQRLTRPRSRPQLTSHTQIIAHSGIFFFNDTATTEIYTLSLHDALPI